MKTYERGIDYIHVVFYNGCIDIDRLRGESIKKAKREATGRNEKARERINNIARIFSWVVYCNKKIAKELADLREELE